MVDSGPVIPPPPVPWAQPAAASSMRPVPGAPGLEYAGLVPRAAAWLLDGLLVILIALVPLLILAFAFTSSVVDGLVALLIQGAYFVLGWRSSARGTPGMRAFKLQIGNIDDGVVISSNKALTRWFALTGWVSVAGLVTAIASAVNLFALIWVIVLLATAHSDPRRQGLHDRWTGTAIVRPVGQSDTAAWVTLILLAILPILAVIAIIALIFLGAQVSGILSNVGSSI